MDLLNLSIKELHSSYLDSTADPVEVADFFLKRVEKLDGKINAFLRLNREKIIKSAEESKERYKNGSPLSTLDGVPVAIKDNIAEKGEKLTCASRILENFTSPYDAEVITRLKNAGAVLFGRTNMDEFAMGSSTENSAFGPTFNPWDTSRVPGGSSGGSAAAVAAGMCPAALGSDTGGSIRQPASLCGIAGLKPTYGRVSRYGLVAFASSLDQIGPMAKNVSDIRDIYLVIAGWDPKDSTCSDVPLNSDTVHPKHLKIGVPRGYLPADMDGDVKKAFENCIEALKQAGAEIIDIDLPSPEAAVSAYYIVANAEASANLARYDGVRYGMRAKEAENLEELYKKTRSKGFGTEVKRRILLGTYVLSAGYYEAYYKRALRFRSMLRKNFFSALKKCDVIATPTSPSAAFKVGEKIKDPMSMYLSDVYTVSVNLAGLPALSVPAGLDRRGMPIGLQFIGKPFDEFTLFYAGEILENNHPSPIGRPEK